MPILTNTDNSAVFDASWNDVQGVREEDAAEHNIGDQWDNIEQVVVKNSSNPVHQCTNAHNTLLETNSSATLSSSVDAREGRNHSESSNDIETKESANNKKRRNN